MQGRKYLLLGHFIGGIFRRIPHAGVNKEIKPYAGCMFCIELMLVFQYRCGNKVTMAGACIVFVLYSAQGLVDGDIISSDL